VFLLCLSCALVALEKNFFKEKIFYSKKNLCLRLQLRVRQNPDLISANNSKVNGRLIGSSSVSREASED